MNRPMSRVRRRVMERAVRPICEPVEARRMLCALHAAQLQAPVELYPGQTPPADDPGAPEGGANIVWTNRGQASDRFVEVFGATGAEPARLVVDAVLTQYERIITDFNYGDGSFVYNLTLEMAPTGGNGLGASARVDTTVFGKPKSGRVTIQRGTDGSGAGWFVDPTPGEHSEFLGPITNAYAGDAPDTSPAFNLSDFYTVVAAELAHCMGLFGGTATVPMWDLHTANTFISDSAEGGGVSHFWTFTGPSIKHLMTGFNAGTPNSFPGAIHTAGPSAPITIGADVFRGAQDVGNALYETGRRYLPADTMRLMFKDAYAYTTLNPAQFGTFHATLGAGGQLRVRGAEGVSDDRVTISSSGATITVSVDLGNDVPGTGALAGAGDLPAFVSQFDTAQVSSILVEAGGGDDRVSVQSIDDNTPVTIDAGTGADSIVIAEGSRNLDTVSSLLTVSGGADGSLDKLDLFDGNNGQDDTYTLTGTSFGRTFFGGLNYADVEQFQLNGGSGHNSLLVNGAAPGTDYSLRTGAGDDFISVGNGNLEANLPAGPGLLNVFGDAGRDTMSFSDINSTSAHDTLFSGNRLFKSAVGGGALVSKDVNFSGHESLTVATNDLGTFVRGDVTLSGVPTTINARGGDDTVWLGWNAGNLTAIQGNTTVNGGSGADHLVMWDDFSAENDETIVNTATVSHPGMATVNWGAGVENLTFEGATGDNTFFLQTSATGTRVDVNANAGNDAMWIANNTGNIAITGAAGFDGQAGTDTVYLDDDDVSFASTYTITGSMLSRTNWPGMSYANAETVNVYAQQDNNTFNVHGTAQGCATNIYSNNGNDSFMVGGGDFDGNIRGHVLLAGQGGSDSVFYDDTADSGATDHHLAGNTYRKVVRNTTNPTSGVATTDTVENVTVSGSSAAGDSIKVDSTTAGVNTVLQGNGGNDSMTIVALTAIRDLTAIQGPLTLDGGAGTDAVTVNDDSSTASDDYQVGATLQHAGAANITRVDGTIEQYTLNASGGNNAFNVEGTPVTPAGTFTINANNGNDTIFISPAFGTLFNIAGHVVANGGAGADAVAVNDANGAGVSFTLTSTLLTLPFNGADLAYATVESLSVSGGGGANGFVVTSTHAATSVTLSGNGGNDAFTIGNGNWEANCPGQITIDGGAGAGDSMLNDDINDTGNDQYFAMANSTSKLPNPTTVSYGGLEDYILRASNAGGDVFIDGTFPGTWRVNGNGGDDLLAVIETSAATTLTLDGNDGPDRVRVNADGAGSASARFVAAQDLAELTVGSGGSLQIAPGGGNVVNTRQLNVGAGRLNINDNPVIVDYAGASPVASIGAMIASAYNNGAWNGPGVTSLSTAPNKGVGYAESSEVFSTFPATFAGQSVDNTAVLLRVALYGDANLDGAVNLGDFNRLAANFGSSNRRWSHGDADYNGTINLADFNKLASNFGAAGAALPDDGARLPDDTSSEELLR